MTQRYLSAEKQTHDDFDQPFTFEEGEHVYDAATRQGPWATMTEASFAVFGRGRLGTGLGQCYKRDAQGQLHKVKG